MGVFREIYLLLYNRHFFHSGHFRAPVHIYTINMSDKMSTIKLDKETRRLRRGTKAVYIMALPLFPIATLILALLPGMGFVPVYPSGDPLLNTPQMLLSVVSILFLIIGLFWPRLARWHKKAYINDVELLYGHVVRATFLTTPVIYGFILRMLGSSWYIILPIYILEFAALIWTFPTEKRLAKWRGESRTPNPG